MRIRNKLTAKQRKLWIKMLATVDQSKKKGCKKPAYFDDIEDWHSQDAEVFNKKVEILERYKES